MSVGSILLAFLPDSLQEQISARKFFYKSARLIKDGVSLTHGPWGLELSRLTWNTLPCNAHSLRSGFTLTDQTVYDR